MSATVTCPTCGASVKIPRSAATGENITCPRCAEGFARVALHTEAPLSNHEPTFGFARDEDEDTPETPTVEKQERKRKVQAIEEAGDALEREEEVYKPPPILISGVELLLALLSILGGIAGAISYTIAKRFPTFLEATCILGYVGAVGLYGWWKYKIWRDYQRTHE